MTTTIDRVNRIRMWLGVWVFEHCPWWLRSWLGPRLMPSLDYLRRTSVLYDFDEAQGSRRTAMAIDRWIAEEYNRLHPNIE